ncbi:hypothetical protein DL770_001477 [Monosporascus sp. CRB-9-2]|nr:hypothetical protein DL770_001477 [Monosporascus sp. CRB-9-2]
MTSVAPPERPRQTDVAETFQKISRAPDSSSQCSSPQSTSAPSSVPSPARPTFPSPSTNPGQAVVATATATRGSPPCKPGVRFSGRRSFAKRPAITSRWTSSDTSDSTRGNWSTSSKRAGRSQPGPPGSCIDEFAPRGASSSPWKSLLRFTRDIVWRLRFSRPRLAPPPDQSGSRPRVPGLTPAGFQPVPHRELRAYPDEEFRRPERIAADGGGPGSAGAAGVASQAPHPLPLARQAGSGREEDLRSRFRGPRAPSPQASPIVSDRGPLHAITHRLSPSPSPSSPSPMTSTAATAVAGPEGRGSTAAAARATATARSNSWRYVPGALRAIPDERPGAAGASRSYSYSYSVSYVPPTTGMSTTNPAPASFSATSIDASTAPPLPPPPVPTSLAVPRRRGSSSRVSPGPRDHQKEPAAWRRPLSRCRRGGGGGGGAERSASMGAERTTTTVRRHGDRHGMEMVEEEDHGSGGGGGGSTWGEVLRAQMEGARRGWREGVVVASSGIGLRR